MQPRLDELRTRMLEEGQRHAGVELELAVLADAAAPWGSIAAIGKAATDAGFVRIRFVFHSVSKEAWRQFLLGTRHEIDAPEDLAYLRTLRSQASRRAR